MDPYGATLSEALAELRDARPELTESIFRAEFALWVGSGISRDRFPSLGSLLSRLIRSLAALVDPANPNCPYKRALDKVTRHATICCPDFSAPPPAFIEQLCRQYSKVLEEDVRAPAGDRSLVFDVLDLPRVYSDPAVSPDAEHRFIALLILEGVVPRILTTNWDALIEAAYEAARVDSAPCLPVVVTPTDLDGVGIGPRLVKIHGCAIRAAADPTQAAYFVATQKRINEWNTSPQHQAIREEVRQAVRIFPALLLGLSAQDINIQIQFESALAGRQPWARWSPPRAAFAQADASEAQERILRTLYGDSYTGHAALEIERAATLGLYAKALLGALYFELLFRKLESICDSASGILTEAHTALVRAWLSDVRIRLVQYYDWLSPHDRWMRLSECLPRFVAHAQYLYRLSRPLPRDTAYVPVSRAHLGQQQGTPEDARALLCLAALNHGEVLGAWSAEPPRPTQDAFHARLNLGSISLRVAVLRDSPVAMVRYEEVFDPGSASETVVIYPTGARRRSGTRGIRSTLPTHVGSSSGPFELWFDEVASEPLSPAELVEQLKLELLGIRRAVG